MSICVQEWGALCIVDDIDVEAEILGQTGRDGIGDIGPILNGERGLFSRYAVVRLHGKNGQC